MEEQKILPFVQDDGGRSKYFKATNVGDCVTRAVAIASGKDYKEIYEAIKRANGETPRNGANVKSKAFKALMTDLGFKWISTSGIGVSLAVHFIDGELPKNKNMVCSVTGHYVAVVNNELHDTWDSRYNRFGQLRRIYGYWMLDK